MVGIGTAKADIVASGIVETLRDIGPVLGLAGAVYLLAVVSVADRPDAGGEFADRPSAGGEDG